MTGIEIEIGIHAGDLVVDPMTEIPKTDSTDQVETTIITPPRPLKR